MTAGDDRRFVSRLLQTPMDNQCHGRNLQPAADVPPGTNIQPWLTNVVTRQSRDCQFAAVFKAAKTNMTSRQYAYCPRW